jgi:hypothetical protein
LWDEDYRRSTNEAFLRWIEEKDEENVGVSLAKGFVEEGLEMGTVVGLCSEIGEGCSRVIGRPGCLWRCF